MSSSITDRVAWTTGDVAQDSDFPVHSLKTYLEQTDLRRFLLKARGSHRSLFRWGSRRETNLRNLADIGAGYGRLTPVLGEFGRVTAFEREPALVELGQGLIPDVTWCRVDRLDQLPVRDGAFDLALSFTVLQHLSDEDAAAVVREMRRVAPSAILLCEETDSSHHWEDPERPGLFSIGRDIKTYEALLAPMRLIAKAPRRMAVNYGRSIGSFMLFMR